MIFANTEFYYAPPENIVQSTIVLAPTESKHIKVVMRHSIDDIVFVTDGQGNIFESKITKIEKNDVLLTIIKNHMMEERFPNITFYIPLLKSSERMELALEKCIELGFTKFVIFSAAKSPKKRIKLDRLNKIAIAAMKQSLHSIRPSIKTCDQLESEDIAKSNNVVFEQLSSKPFVEYIEDINHSNQYNLLFGPEAGLTKEEFEIINPCIKVFISKNRLRSETAITSAAVLLSSIYKS